MPVFPDVRNDIRALQLVLTAACNLRCAYCYQNDKQNRRIEWEVVRAALDRLLASRHQNVKVLFIGGEPLLEFPIIERAVAYLEQRRRRGTTIRYATITNGLLLGDQHLQFFVNHDVHMQVSFDGVPAAQALRGEHTFEKLDALLDRVRGEHPAFYDGYFRVNITLLPSTIPWLADSIEYFIAKKLIHDLSITPQITPADDWRLERIEELERAFRRIFRLSLRRFRSTGEVPLEVFRKTEERPRLTTERSMCGVGRGDQLAVDVDGQSHGCVMFVQSYQVFPTIFLRSRIEAMRLGDIRDPAFEQRAATYPAAAKSAEIFHHKEQKYSSYGRCGECRYLDGCSVCPMSIGRVEGQMDPHRIPDFNCAYNLVSLKYRAKFPRARLLHERWLKPRHRATQWRPARRSSHGR